jgi:hypothetical protein
MVQEGSQVLGELISSVRTWGNAISLKNDGAIVETD